MTSTLATMPSRTLHPGDLPQQVARCWPELSWTSVEIPQQGLDHAVIIVRGVRGLADHAIDVVARSPLTDTYRRQAANESAVLAELGGLTTTRLPQTLRQSADATLTLQSCVPGQPLTTELWAMLTPAQRQQAITQLAELMTALHSRDITQAPIAAVTSWWTATGASNPDPRALPGKAQLLAARAQAVLLPRLSPADRHAAEEMLSGITTLTAHPRQHCLIHGDLYDTHLLWADGLGVVDFSDMTLGDPAVDYANLFDIDPELPAAVAATAGLSYAPGLLQRAWAYKRWDAVYLLVDHLRTGRTDGALAWQLFSTARHAVPPGPAAF